MCELRGCMWVSVWAVLTSVERERRGESVVPDRIIFPHILLIDFRGDVAIVTLSHLYLLIGVEEACRKERLFELCGYCDII